MAGCDADMTSEALLFMTKSVWRTCDQPLDDGGIAISLIFDDGFGIMRSRFSATSMYRAVFSEIEVSLSVMSTSVVSHPPGGLTDKGGSAGNYTISMARDGVTSRSCLQLSLGETITFLL
jgi:hypothetical protein